MVLLMQLMGDALQLALHSLVVQYNGAFAHGSG
jgi:hypothetical protein